MPSGKLHDMKSLKRRLGLTMLAGAGATLLAVASCGGGGGGSGNAVMPSNTIDTRTVVVSSSTVTPAAGVAPVKATVLANGLHRPWGLAFLPDGRMLVTERDGTLLLVSVSGNVTTLSSVPGVPPVYAQGQGGLLDVQVDPLFATSQPWVYWTYAEAGTGSDAGKAGTAVARGKLVDGRLQDVTVIFRQKPKMNTSNNHFCSRLVFRGDGTLFVTLGERQADSTTSPTTDFAQNLTRDLGKVVRINKDGTPAAGNPNWGVAGALPEIWSTGHRNPQGAALNPATGELWVSEHGPQGGDEVNLALAGRNFGWPLRSYGCPYEVATPGPACQINGGTHAPEFTEPLTYWVPTSTAPSGMAFYTGVKLPEWQGKLLLGALSGQSVWQLTLSGNTVLSKDELFKNAFGRIRDVRQGPDGWLYLLVDDASNGRLIRIER